MQSKCLDLFIECGNKESNVGDNRDCWVINPRATSKKHLRKFHFLGCLMGMSVRTGILMNFNLAPMVWKRLTGDRLTAKDIEAIDVNYIHLLNEMKAFRDEGNPEAKFRELYPFSMAGKDSAGDLHPFPEQDPSEPVTYANLDKYVELSIQNRFTESKEQYKAIVDGFDAIFKSTYLKMISWQDLEEKVVGSSEVDVARLKEMTQYKNCSASHEVVKRFWKVLQSFENTDRQRYLRFVWGRTRLPHKDATDIEQHTIQLSESLHK